MAATAVERHVNFVAFLPDAAAIGIGVPQLTFRRRLLMKATALKTMSGCGLALAFSAALFAAPASASSVSNAVYRGDSSGSFPSSSQEVRRVIIVTPPYANDPYYYGAAYYGPPAVAYGYAPPPAAYEYAPPPGAYYGPGPGVALAGPGPSCRGRLLASPISRNFGWPG